MVNMTNKLRDLFHKKPATITIHSYRSGPISDELLNDDEKMDTFLEGKLGELVGRAAIKDSK